MSSTRRGFAVVNQLPAQPSVLRLPHLARSARSRLVRPTAMNSDKPVRCAFTTGRAP